DFAITCLANCDSLVEEMWLYYKINDAAEFQTTPIYLVCPTHYGVIEGLMPTDTVHYFIEGRSGSNTVTYPLSSPEGYFTFWFDIVGKNEFGSNASDYSVYPNPSTGKITIETKTIDEILTIQLRNIQGELVYYNSVNTRQTIDLGNDIKHGIYIMQIESESAIQTIKVIIY
ncbi:MAG: hypothetical protein C0591_13505, partial [Marinilabiliales bacterium]